MVDVPPRPRCFPRPQVNPTPDSSGDPFPAAGDWPFPPRTECGEGIDDTAALVTPSAEGGPITVYLSIGLPADAMPSGLAEIQHSLADAAQRMTRSGHPVHYVNGMYMPAQTRLLCVFTGESEEAVQAAVRLLRLPFVQLKAVAEDQGPAPWDGEPGR